MGVSNIEPTSYCFSSIRLAVINFMVRSIANFKYSQCIFLNLNSFGLLVGIFVEEYQIS
jgi:hypothetical protein